MNVLKKLEKNEAEKLQEELYSNSSILLEIGKFAAQKENYGVAISLSILGAEELAKAIVIYLHLSGVNIFEINELNQIFYKHKRKHEFAILFEVLKVIETFFLNENTHNKVKKREETGMKFIDKVVGFLDQVSEVLEPLVKVGEHIEWWDKADSMKNMGFYVDYRHDKIESPTRITLEEYNKTIKIIDEFKNRFRVLKIMFERYGLEKSQIIDQINEGLDLMKNYNKN